MDTEPTVIYGNVTEEWAVQRTFSSPARHQSDVFVEERPLIDDVA